VVAQKAPDDILAQISRNFFRAFVPKADSPVSVNDINAGFEAVEDGLIDFGIVEFGHATTPTGAGFT